MSGGKHRPPLILGMYIDLRVKSRDLCAFPYEYRDYVDGRFGGYGLAARVMLAGRVLDPVVALGQIDFALPDK